ncbi:MAG: histidine phosphatase family protein, partial [Candidatus Methylomirabilales bacterium]
MLLVLVRHAETEVTGKRLTGWLPGYHLSGKGEKEAEAVAERLGRLPVAAVYSSPLERCVETAAPVAARHRLEVKILPDLGEMRYGDWEGRPLKALYRTKAWTEMIARPSDFRFPNGETIREAQTRFIRGTESLLGRHQGKAVVAVTHADPIRLI